MASSWALRGLDARTDQQRELQFAAVALEGGGASELVGAAAWAAAAVGSARGNREHPNDLVP